VKSAVKRPYRSRLRQVQAESTRLLVIRAAARLFAERGYGATSIDAVAAVAGVGRATVFTSVGGKLALLKAAYDVAIVGDDEPVPLTDRPRSRRIKEDPDPRRMLGEYARLVTEIGGRVAQIYEALRGAAGTDAGARRLWDTVGRERRVGAANLISALIRHGTLRNGLDREAAADLVWVLNDPGLYHQLVLERSWTPDRYRVWLTETMQAQLLTSYSGRLTGLRHP
jgi:AcrR family transcriptional regulator